MIPFMGFKNPVRMHSFTHTSIGKWTEKGQEYTITIISLPLEKGMEVGSEGIFSTLHICLWYINSSFVI